MIRDDLYEHPNKHQYNLCLVQDIGLYLAQTNKKHESKSRVRCDKGDRLDIRGVCLSLGDL